MWSCLSCWANPILLNSVYTPQPLQLFVWHNVSEYLASTLETSNYDFMILFLQYQESGMLLWKKCFANYVVNLSYWGLATSILGPLVRSQEFGKLTTRRIRNRIMYFGVRKFSTGERGFLNPKEQTRNTFKFSLPSAQNVRRQILLPPFRLMLFGLMASLTPNTSLHCLHPLPIPPMLMSHFP